MITPLEQTLIGAAAGALSAGTASICAMAMFARRSERNLRRDARIESALEEILKLLELEQWTAVAQYRDAANRVVEQLGKPRPTPGPVAGHIQNVFAAADGAGRADAVLELHQLTTRVLESVRRLRLFVSRVESPAFRAEFTAYFETVMAAHVAAQQISSNSVEPFIVDPQTVSDRMIELLKLTNAALGFEYWDGKDMFQLPLDPLTTQEDGHEPRAEF